MDKYKVLKSFRYGDRVYRPGEPARIKDDDVPILRGRGMISGKVLEATTKPKPPENAMQPKAEPREYPIDLGGGWYELEDGSKVRKSELEGAKDDAECE